MTPKQLRQIRLDLGLTQAAMAKALGYSGNQVRSQMNYLETGQRRIMPSVARLAKMYEKHGIAPEFAGD